MTIKLTQDGSVNFIQAGNTTASNSVADVRFTNIGNSSTYMTITTAGNVGIGTTSPTQRLDVSGALRVTSGGLMATFNSNTVGSIITTAGNVGISTSSPRSTLTIGGSNTTGTLVFSNTGSNTGLRSAMQIGYATAALDLGVGYRRVLEAFTGINNGVGEFDDQTDLRFFTTSGTTAERIRITPTGNVGIGTTSPNGKLTIAGTPSSVSFGNRLSFNLYNTSSSGNQSNQIALGSAGSEVNSGYILTDPNADGTSTNILAIGAASASGVITFNTVNSEKMRITAAGNVGIGTTAPSANLHILGQANDSGSMIRVDCGTGTGQATLRLIAGSGSTNRASRIDFFNNVTSTSVPRWSLMNDYDQNGTNDFRIVGPGDTVRFTLNTAGNIGIGTSDPNERLHVNSASGSNYLRLSASNGQCGIQIGGTSTSWWIYKESGNSDLNWYDGGTIWMTLKHGTGRLGLGTASPGYKLDVQGGDINASGSVRSNGTALTSDQRVKENIIDANTQDNLEHILALEVKYYDYTQAFLDHTERPDQSNYGFIAQQVKQIIPTAVDIQPVSLYKTVTNQVPILDIEGNPTLDEEGNEIITDKVERVVEQEIPDFHFLKKDLIFTEAVGAIQELHKLYTQLKQEFDEYKQSHP